MLWLLKGKCDNRRSGKVKVKVVRMLVVMLTVGTPEHSIKSGAVHSEDTKPKYTHLATHQLPYEFFLKHHTERDTHTRRSRGRSQV